MTKELSKSNDQAKTREEEKRKQFEENEREIAKYREQFEQVKVELNEAKVGRVVTLIS